MFGRYRGSTGGPIKVKYGTLMNTGKELNKKKDGPEHFHEVLNRPSPDKKAVILEATGNLDIDTDPQLKMKSLCTKESSTQDWFYCSKCIFISIVNRFT